MAREYSEEEEQCKSNLITTEATKHVFHDWLKISIVGYLLVQDMLKHCDFGTVKTGHIMCDLFAMITRGLK